MNERISIILPTYNAEKTLSKLLISLEQQTINDYQLIIIDSSSTDNTIELVKPYTKDIIVIPQSEFDHGGTRTLAAHSATGDILVFLTQDVKFTHKTSLNDLVKVFNDEKIGAAYGRQIAYQETNLFGRHLRAFNYSSQSYIRDKSDIAKYGIKTVFFSDSFSAYRKSALQNVNWFKKGLLFGEDTLVVAKILLSDYKIAYASDAVVYHSHSYSVFQEFKRCFDIGVFHAMENWLLETYGNPEGEGMKYIKSEILYLLQNNAWYLFPAALVRNIMKFSGYKLGRHYDKLPTALIKKISMQPNWWKT